MPLATGQSLSFYEILGPLGAGGMGEVYRARDTRLEREVAIKVLPEELADDEERLRRFEREAKTLASLNHPNVAGIHGVDQENGTWFLALELVPGEDLALRISRGPLPAEDAIDVCRQIAAGLEAAHEAGVVHRDLKPANVRITPDGVVKILDFGLAKPIRPGAGDGGSSTAESDSFRMTEEGLVLGTPTYMSPEQARGRAVDRRTDVWAFGCVLYECLTGRRAFDGESLTDVLAAIVQSEPDRSRLPASTPAPVVELLTRALEKDPRNRLRDIGEARVVLERGASGSWRASSMWGGTAAAAPPARGGRRALAATALVAAALGALGARVLLPGPAIEDDAPGPVRRIALYDESSLPERVGLSDIAGLLEASPGGGRLLTRTRGGLFVRTLDSLDTLEVPAADGERVNHAVWSSDGSEVVYALGRDVYRVEVPGLRSRRIAELEYAVWAMACLGDAVVFQSPETGELLQLPLGGGQPEVFLGGLPAGLRVVDLRPVHGSEHLLALCEDEADRRWIAAVGRDGFHDLLDLEKGARFPCHLPSGHILFQHGTEEPSLWSVPFDVDGLRVTGQPALALEGRAPTTSADGSVFYLATGDPGVARLAWVDERGVVEEFGDEHESIWRPYLDPTGSRIVFSPRSSGQIWSHDVGRGTSVLLATVEAPVAAPWAFASGRVGYHGSDGSTQLLPRGPGGEREPWLPAARKFHAVLWVEAEDARALLADVRGDRLLLQELEAGRPHGEPVVLREGIDDSAAMSPDGGWYLFPSDHSGEQQHYLSSYPHGEEVWPLGHHAHRVAFGPAGDEVLYVDDEDVVWRMDLSTGDPPVLGTPESLIDLHAADLETIVLHRWPDQERFLATRRLRKGKAMLVMLENWRPR